MEDFITMSKNFDDILAKLKTADIKKMSVAVAQDTHVLEAVRVAKERGIVEPILVGDIHSRVEFLSY